MTALTEPPVRPALNALTFLLPGASVEVLRRRLAEVGVPEQGKALADRVRRLLADQLAEACLPLLDVDLGAAVASGWQLHERLLEAARQTRAAPGTSVVLDLATHTITGTWRPRVDVFRDGQVVAHVALELDLQCRLVGLHATVVAGRLQSVGGGHGTLSVSLAMSGQTLLTRTSPFDAGAEVRLGPGLDLLGTAHPDASPHVVETPGDQAVAGCRHTCPVHLVGDQAST